MRIITDPKLDFNDVLIVPKRSTLASRSEVRLEKRYLLKHSGFEYQGIPIIAANMDGVGTMTMARALSAHGLSTALTKHRSVEQWVASLQFFYSIQQYSSIIYSMGISERDQEKYEAVKRQIQPRLVCIDVANFYSEAAINFLRRFREANPTVGLIAGNVATPEVTEELILAGADIVKVGIGPGSVCFVKGTPITLADGTQKPIEEIREGDEVLTHLQRPRKVTQTYRRRTSTLCKVNGLQCTPEHPFWTITKDDLPILGDEDLRNKARWVEAKDLTPNHYLIQSN